MLVGFSFKNYASFFDETIFTMKASSDKQYSLINTNKTKYGELLKSAFIFGSNGSGKSNFIEALAFMKNVVISDLDVQSKLISAPNSFIFNNSASDRATSFEARFIVDDMMYEYGFEILHGEVNKEYLFKKNERMVEVFNRTGPDFNTISLKSDMDNVKGFRKNTRRDTLFLYWANFGNNILAMDVYKWFKQIQIFDADDTSKLLTATIDYIENTTNGKENVLEFLQRADVNMLDFDYKINVDGGTIDSAIKKSYVEKVPKVASVSMNTKHNIYSDKWEKVGVVSTNIAYESAGTRKLFELAGPIINALEYGNLVLIDEIDSRLHPKLVRFLVMMFNSISENPKNAQFICNTHNALLLNEDIRRDQIYFIEKNEYGVSKLYSLTDFKGIRKNSVLLKKYLVGAFGATPKLREFSLVK